MGIQLIGHHRVGRAPIERPTYNTAIRVLFKTKPFIFQDNIIQNKRCLQDGISRFSTSTTIVIITQTRNTQTAAPQAVPHQAYPSMLRYKRRTIHGSSKGAQDPTKEFV
jgi:hypothetical protein